jgi:hypothetical protein
MFDAGVDAATRTARDPKCPKAAATVSGGGTQIVAAQHGKQRPVHHHNVEAVLSGPFRLS